MRGCLEEYFSARDKAEVTETVKELQAKTEAASIFEQIPLVAVSKMRGVDWKAITVSHASLTGKLCMSCDATQSPLPMLLDYH